MMELTYHREANAHDVQRHAPMIVGTSCLAAFTAFIDLVVMRLWTVSCLRP